MENPFKEIIQNEKLSDTLKQKVLDDIHLINLSLNIAELYIVKFPKVANEFLDLSDSKKNKNNKK
ncbi:hypothetical protein ACF3NR_00525 [Vaginella massiliensis]|uniref:hypothetical protein n=1 Tax=Vaginella massiliensis TaxID=1816680 RepID=UPI003750F71C